MRDRNPLPPWNPRVPAEIKPCEFEKIVLGRLRKCWTGDDQQIEAKHLGTIKGTRGEYKIDVLAKINVFRGAEVIVLVECKHQRRPVERRDEMVLKAKLLERPGTQRRAFLYLRLPKGRASIRDCAPHRYGCSCEREMAVRDERCRERTSGSASVRTASSLRGRAHDLDGRGRLVPYCRVGTDRRLEGMVCRRRSSRAVLEWNGRSRAPLRDGEWPRAAGRAHRDANCGACPMTCSSFALYLRGLCNEPPYRLRRYDA